MSVNGGKADEIAGKADISETALRVTSLDHSVANMIHLMGKTIMSLMRCHRKKF